MKTQEVGYYLSKSLYLVNEAVQDGGGDKRLEALKKHLEESLACCNEIMQGEQSGE